MAGEAKDRRDRVTSAEKIAFLSDPASYPDHPEEIVVKTTHMSWVFLTPHHAYKLKKPVWRRFLDYSTVEARRGNCEAEVRLNRRLAPDVYLGVVALSLDNRNRLHLGRPGRVVDWLVQMRRLPEERTLENALLHRTLETRDLQALCRCLAVFYRQSEQAAITAEDYLGRFAQEIAATHSELTRPEFGLPRAPIDRLARRQFAFLGQHGELLRARACGGKIVEGHGDLRPEHIYLGRPPIIVDCLEFNPALRQLDPIDELSFLAIECTRLGAPAAGSFVLELYGACTGDRPPPRLIAFYQSFRAYLRAKIAIWHLDDRQVEEPSRWTRRSAHYLELAGRCSSALETA